MSDDYLWDGSGEPDPEVRRLEVLLERFRHVQREANQANATGSSDGAGATTVSDLNVPALASGGPASSRAENHRRADPAISGAAVRHDGTAVGQDDPEPGRRPGSQGKVVSFSLGRFVGKRRVAVSAIAACVLLVVAGLVGMRSFWKVLSPAGARWDVIVLAGEPTVASSRLDGAGTLSVGEWIETDAASRARVKVGLIGEAEIDPNTRVRLLKAGGNEHRLGLERGTLHARIWAPPRLFFVETPSAVAVDLGCAYTLTVDDAGGTLLRVETGWVAFEDGGRESFVPAGAVCKTAPGRGPGTPYYTDAPEQFVEALGEVDGGVVGGVTGGVQGSVAGGVRGAVPGGVQGGVEGGEPGGVAGGVTGDVTGGVPGGVEGGVRGGVEGGVSRGMTGGVQGGVAGGSARGTTGGARKVGVPDVPAGASAGSPTGAAHDRALESLLAASRKRDALTLWHLLSRTESAERARVYERMAELVPPPDSVTREGVLAGDRHMIDLWWDQLGLGVTSWWRLWKSPGPPQVR